MADFKDRVMVITGAGGDIPSAIARRLAARGAHLVLTDIDRTRLGQLAEQLPGAASVQRFRHDVTDPEDAGRLASACESEHGRVDGIVTGAGLYEHLPLDTLTTARWRRAVEVNLDGVFHTVQALRPLLSEGSAIVNITSVAGHRGSIDHTPYASAKGGVLALTRSLAQELAPRTRVNAVSPGLIDTRMLRSLDSRRRYVLTEATPLRRLGSVDDVAGAVLFLCSQEASFITAETLHVNGGLYIAS